MSWFRNIISGSRSPRERSEAVTTASTPGAVPASSTSIDSMRANASGERT
jgi:hypothetical protein